MAKILRTLKNAIFAIIIFPHLLAYKLSRRGKMFKLDLQCMFGNDNLSTFVCKMREKKYIRNLFYYRMGYTFFELFSFLCQSDKTLHLMGCGKLGKHSFLQHSQNTFLNADKIGDNFYCLHNVTVGNDRIKGRPTIGNNVTIYTGAVVVGNISIGNNVIIAANAVVRSNVPNNVLVSGVPAKIVKLLK